MDLTAVILDTFAYLLRFQLFLLQSLNRGLFGRKLSCLLAWQANYQKSNLAFWVCLLEKCYRYPTTWTRFVAVEKSMLIVLPLSSRKLTLEEDHLGLKQV